jgi:hypothetical protein
MKTMRAVKQANDWVRPLDLNLMALQAMLLCRKLRSTASYKEGSRLGKCCSYTWEARLTFSTLPSQTTPIRYCDFLSLLLLLEFASHFCNSWYNFFVLCVAIFESTPFCLSVYVPTKTNYTNCLSVVTVVHPPLTSFYPSSSTSPMLVSKSYFCNAFSLNGFE